MTVPNVRKHSQYQFMEFGKQNTITKPADVRDQNTHAVEAVIISTCSNNGWDLIKLFRNVRLTLEHVRQLQDLDWPDSMLSSTQLFVISLRLWI